MASRTPTAPRSHVPGAEALPESLAKPLSELRQELHQFLKGKEALADTLLSALMSSGHVLFEDVPGVGKTTLVKAVAKWLGLAMSRVQCTSDLLPSDILGVEVYRAETGRFEFHEGPIFAHLLLVDELNRASPRTQSALLEAMAEGIVSINRHTHPLPKPFIVFATQNPSDAIGTYPLPESQLDRFSCKLRLGYPSDERERALFASPALDPLAELKERVLDKESFELVQKATEGVFVSERVVGYARRIVEATRAHESFKLGLSTRGAVTWLRMARAYALLHGRMHVLPDDLLFLAEPCLAHRLMARTAADPRAVLADLLNTLPVD